MPSPWVYAPGTPPVGVLTTVTCMPTALASAAVRPTAHTCGSVNVTRGTMSWEATSATSRPKIAAAAILGRDVADVASHGVVPRVTFTDPQVCAVGRTAAEARAAGLRVTVVTTPTGEVPGAYTQGNGIRGTSQLVIDDDRRTVAGATFTGPGLQELLHSATVAITGGVTVDRLWHAVPSFPTVSEVWLHLLEAYGL